MNILHREKYDIDVTDDVTVQVEIKMIQFSGLIFVNRK